MADGKDITAAELQSRRRPGRMRHPAAEFMLDESTPVRVDGEVITGAVPPRELPKAVAPDEASPPPAETKPPPAEAKPESAETKPEPTAAEKRLAEVERELSTARDKLQSSTAAAETQATMFRERLAQMDALEAQLREREETLKVHQSQLEEANTRIRTFERANRQQSVESLLRDTLDKIGPDADLDVDQARHLSAQVLRPALNGVVESMAAQQATALESLQADNVKREATLQAELKALRDKLTARDEAETKAAFAARNKAVLDKHPDFYDFNKSNSFIEFGAMSPEFSLDTYDVIMRRAYESGNTDTLNAVLDKFKIYRDGGRADPAATAEVPIGTDSASQPASTKGEKTYTYDDLAELRAAFQRSDITRDEFQRRKKKFLKAEKEGRVLG